MVCYLYIVINYKNIVNDYKNIDTYNYEEFIYVYDMKDSSGAYVPNIEIKNSSIIVKDPYIKRTIKKTNERDDYRMKSRTIEIKRSKSSGSPSKFYINNFIDHQKDDFIE